jgi:hypothetical protein
MRDCFDSSKSNFFVVVALKHFLVAFEACTFFCFENTSANLMNSMVIKGRRRDTAWYSVIDDEWKGGVKEALEKWLAKENFDKEGKQVRKLEEIREALGS